MPDASVEEQLEAEYAFNEFLLVAYRMYLRLEAEGKLGCPRDKSGEGATVNGKQQPST